MELDDNGSEKSDLKDSKTMALLVKDGRFSTSYLPSGVYAESREGSACRNQIIKQAYTYTFVKTDTGMVSEVLSRVS